MKKILALLLTLSMIFTLAALGGGYDAYGYGEGTHLAGGE